MNKNETTIDFKKRIKDTYIKQLLKDISKGKCPLCDFEIQETYDEAEEAQQAMCTNKQCKLGKGYSYGKTFLSYAHKKFGKELSLDKYIAQTFKLIPISEIPFEDAIDYNNSCLEEIYYKLPKRNLRSYEPLLKFYNVFIQAARDSQAAILKETPDRIFTTGFTFSSALTRLSYLENRLNEQETIEQYKQRVGEKRAETLRVLAGKKVKLLTALSFIQTVKNPPPEIVKRDEKFNKQCRSRYKYGINYYRLNLILDTDSFLRDLQTWFAAKIKTTNITSEKIKAVFTEPMRNKKTIFKPRLIYATSELETTESILPEQQIVIKRIKNERKKKMLNPELKKELKSNEQAEVIKIKDFNRTIKNELPNLKVQDNRELEKEKFVQWFSSVDPKKGAEEFLNFIEAFLDKRTPQKLKDAVISEFWLKYNNKDISEDANKLALIIVERVINKI